VDSRRDPPSRAVTSTSIADVKTTDAQRLGFTVIGLALILLASGIALGWAHYLQVHPSSVAVEP
jgi:hypothetical protein